MKIEILKIKLKVKDVEIELTMDEARSLFSDLRELFGEKTVFVPSEPIVIERPTWPYPQPIWVSPPTFTPDYQPKWGAPEITCLCQGMSS